MATLLRFSREVLLSNDNCVSFSDATWLSTNFGIIVCIECSGIHRDLGVHISRIQSLTLDNVGTAQLLLARHMTNQAFNEVMEATLRHNLKPSPTSTMWANLRFSNNSSVCSHPGDIYQTLSYFRLAVFTFVSWYLGKRGTNSYAPSTWTRDTWWTRAPTNVICFPIWSTPLIIATCSNFCKFTLRTWIWLRRCQHR